MSAFEEFMFDENYVLRFYRVDHGLVCTINESMVSELRELEAKLRQQQAEIEALNQRIERMIENASHHEGIAHAGGFETGYQAGLKKAQENG